MGTAPSPVNVAANVVDVTSQSLPTTTASIEAANRLMSVTSNPGFIDIVRISAGLVQEAVDATSNFPGWDPLQITILKVRQQVAKEHHDQLFGRIREAIQTGIQEAKDLSDAAVQAATNRAQMAADALEQGDLVRQKVLQNFEDRDNRIPGSF